MKTTLKLISNILSIIFIIEVILIPVTLHVNEKHPEVINEKYFLIWDSAIIGITLSIGYTLQLIIKNINKHENKN